MSEWHVSASESEGEERSERKPENGVLELGGLKIPADRMVDLLQVAKRRNLNLYVCVCLICSSITLERPLVSVAYDGQLSTNT